jgi:hypothetical protein
VNGPDEAGEELLPAEDDRKVSGSSNPATWRGWRTSIMLYRARTSGLLLGDCDGDRRHAQPPIGTIAVS